MAISEDALKNFCKACKAEPGENCRSTETGFLLVGRSHFGRVHNTNGPKSAIEWIGEGHIPIQVIDMTDLGPCAGCRRPDTKIYGKNASILCWACRDILEVWRATGAHGRIPYVASAPSITASSYSIAAQT